jgi:uncharacterized protein YecT (DUF1311 family)
MEGCLEHAIVRGDRRIDATVRGLFAALPARTARVRIVAAERAWARYRQASCRSAAELYDDGGSGAPVAFADCVRRRNAVHLADDRAFLRELTRR